MDAPWNGTTIFSLLYTIYPNYCSYIKLGQKLTTNNYSFLMYLWVLHNHQFTVPTNKNALPFILIVKQCERKILAWGKSPNSVVEGTKLSPTVRSMALAPWTPFLLPYHILDWLGIVPVTNKVSQKLTNYQSGLDSFTMINHLKIN